MLQESELNKASIKTLAESTVIRQEDFESMKQNLTTIQPELLSSNVFVVNKDLMKCTKQDHDNNRLKFLCIDPVCKCEAKLACAECILYEHYQHKYVLLEKFSTEVSEKFVKISKQAKAFEEENQMEDFQKKMTVQVHTQFEEIKHLVVNSFEEFEKEYLQNISKILENNKPKLEHRDKFSTIEELSSQKFENFDNSSITNIIDFYQDDKIEKALEENEKHLIKTKDSISKKQTKYFDKFRIIVKDILKNCKQATLKENLCQLPCEQETKTLSQTGTLNQLTEEKKKKKLTISEENNTIHETPLMNQSNFKNISEQQTFAQRSFANESRRFSNGNKKIKTEFNHQQPISTQ